MDHAARDGEGLLSIGVVQRDYLVSVQALSDGQGELEQGLQCAFMVVINPARKNMLTADSISTLCNLTDSETEIVKLIVQEVRPGEVAERRNVSPNMVKKQLRSIMQKMRCAHQADIIGVAAATRIPMAGK